MGRDKRKAFSSIRERVWNKKLHTWKGKLLSVGGKEVLIKSVPQATFMYAGRLQIGYQIKTLL